MAKFKIKEKYWIKYPKKRNTQEWSAMPVDWWNESRLDTVDNYFFRFDNYIKGQSNHFIMKSVFGNKSIKDIKAEIDWWFTRCIGAYNEIELNKQL